MTITQQFDTLAPVGLKGEISQVFVYDPDKDMNRVLELGKDWWIWVEWKLNDDPGNYIAKNLAGTWEVRAKLESMGAGFEGQVGPTQVLPLNGQNTYNTWIHVLTDPPTGDPQNEGAFKLVVLVNYKGPTGAPQPMAGFYEGPMIQFYKPLP